MAAWLRGVLLMGAMMLPLAHAQAQAQAQAQTHTAAGDSRVPRPVIELARAGTQCVADPATMRREHPAMLEHQRDATVHRGIRGAKASLKGCIDCHASAATGSVAQSESNFCVSCHSYTAVRIDCFGCHATQPQHMLAKQKP